MKYKSRYEYIALLILVVVGLTVRLHEVHYNFDGDEIFSVQLASKQFAEMISGSLQDRPHPPLHIILLHLWIKAFGASEVSARALSLLFSGVFLLMSYILLRRSVSSWLALGILSVLALSPLFVYYGQQARPYALIAFLSTVNLLAFMRVLDVPCKRRRMVIWAMSCGLLLYTQYLGALLIAFQICFALIYSRLRRRMIFAYGLVGSALTLPWLIAAMGEAISSGADPLLHISWMVPPTPTEFVWFYVSVFGDVPGLPTRWLLILLVVLGAAYIRRLAASRNLPADHLLLFLIGFGLPTVVYVMSVWGPKSVFASRQLLGAGIAFVAITGLCVATLPRSLAGGFLLALLAWMAAALPAAFPHNAKPPWRDMAAQIDAQYGSMIAVTQESWVGLPLAFYRREGSVRLWGELTEYEKGSRLLFACRPHRCSDVETEALESRRSLLATWRWGSPSETTEFNQLFLYKIKSVN
jgi:4-amino-4-deoxy-L-arabinose transferase-like glycosyltransferase